MVLEKLKLAASINQWRLFTLRKADPAFLVYQKKVFARDDYTCQYCDFRAQVMMEVVNRDGNYRNNQLSNLITACPFCAQCFFLEAIGKSDFGGGVLIYLPDIDQAELNALSHVLFSALMSGHHLHHHAKTLYRSLRLRSQIVEKELGKGMSNPALYGQILIDSEHDAKERVNAELSKQFRLLPQLTRFVTQVECWHRQAIDTMSLR